LTAETSAQKRLGTLLFYGIVLLLAYLVYLVFAPFLVSLAWATVLVVVCYPAYERIARRGGATSAAVASAAAVTAIVIVPTLLVMIAFVRQGVDAMQSIELQVTGGHWAWLNHVWAQIHQRFPEASAENLTASLRSYGERAAEFGAARVGAILAHTAAFIFHLGVTILAMFYLFRDGHSMVDRLREVLPFEAAHRDRMLADARDLIFASVTSSLVAAAAHGILGGLAFTLTSVKEPVFWGVMMAFSSFVPVVGSALVWVPIAISLMLGGHVGRGALLVVFCVVTLGMVENFLRPWLISGRAKMSGLVIFIGVLGGISVFGLLGIVLGPIIVTTAASLLDLYAPRAASGNT